MSESLATRIRYSLHERPWMLDIAVGAWTMGWATWVGLHTNFTVYHAGFRRFASIMPGLTVLVFILGAVQLWSALIKWRHPRSPSALTGMVIWGGFICGVTTPSGQAAYALPTLLNFLILLRCY